MTTINKTSPAARVAPETLAGLTTLDPTAGYLYRRAHWKLNWN
jgi:hypothetical protein